MDGKHINVQIVDLNYKNRFSIVLLAVVDANYKFIYIEGCQTEVSFNKVQYLQH